MNFSELKHTGWDSWRECWETAQRSLITTMLHNMTADIDAGYDILGDCIKSQNEALQFRVMLFKRSNMELDLMEVEKQEKWCFNELKRRGYIE